MTISSAVIASEVISSIRRENVVFGRTRTSFSMSSCGMMVSPVTMTSEML